MSRRRSGDRSTLGWIAGFALLLLLAVIPAAYDWQHSTVDCAVSEGRVLSSQPDRAARLADAIAAEPTLADCALQRRGMTRSDYVDLMDEIADSQSLSVAYAEARKHR